MKLIINRVLVALLLVTLAGAAAFAKTKTTTGVFTTDTKVNGTLVKKGTYSFVVNEEVGTLSVLKDGRVIAKADIRLEKREGKARSTVLRTTDEGMTAALVGITFGGSDQNVLLTQAGMQAGGN